MQGQSMESSEAGIDNNLNNDRKVAEQTIRMRRRAVIFSIATIFCVTAIILVISVMHEEMNKHNVGYQELVCQESDLECFKLICPQGWEWDSENEECAIIQGES